MCSVFSQSLFNVRRFFYKSSYAYTCKVLEFSRITSLRLYTSDNVHKNDLMKENDTEEEKPNLPIGVKSDYQAFQDQDSPVILDVDEEKKKLDLAALNAMCHIQDPYEGLNMRRGVTGVFDIEDLVDLLKKDRAQRIFVTKVPKECNYVDYQVIVSARSEKHIAALATFVRKAYKLKRNSNDIIPKIEGVKSKDWIALDLGNIALHIFSQPARDRYDLEILWAIGANYDKQSLNIETVEELEDKYMKILEGLQPADNAAVVDTLNS